VHLAKVRLMENPIDAGTGLKAERKLGGAARGWNRAEIGTNLGPEVSLESRAGTDRTGAKVKARIEPLRVGEEPSLVGKRHRDATDVAIDPVNA